MDTMKVIRIEENKKLCKEFPFLIPRNRWTGEIPDDYDYTYTELDDENGELQAIETEEEWAMIQDAIDQYVEENFNDCEGCEDCDDCDEDGCDCSSCPHSK